MANLAKTISIIFISFSLISLVILSSTPVSVASPSEDSWVSRAPMQVARGGLGVAVVDGKIYAIGGYSGVGQTLTTNEEYDPATDSWIFKASSPVPLAFFGITVYQDKIYCIDSDKGVTAVYTPSTDKWDTKASLPHPREGITAVTAADKIYVIGGNSSVTDVYYPVNDVWTTKKPLPYTPYLRWGWTCATVTIDNEIHVISAQHPGSHEIYNPFNDTWRSGASVMRVFFSSAGVTTGIDERIYVFSGDRPYWDSGEIYFPTQSYNPANDGWTNGTSMPTGRLEAGVAVVDNLVYVIGGFTPWMGNNWDPSTANEQYIPFGYDTSGSAAYLPKITIQSVSNQTYNSSSIPLNFTVNKPISWMGYSLDGQDNTTVTGNITLSGLSVGSHNLTVYARDSFGNEVASDTIEFTVAPEPFPIVILAFALCAVPIVAASALLLYRRKHSRSSRIA